mmetsp:Transcript_4537/g.12803  ORF Transcript_4537/g.12803 Transcript_4537/m.12803 type:complete len:472 (+) Transcript_4537:740-2155(+)
MIVCIFVNILTHAISVRSHPFTRSALTQPVTGVEDLKNVATIASGSIDMGRIIAQAADKVGDTGSTVVEESQTLVDEIEFTEGLTIDRGYVSPYLVKDQERQVAEMQSPRVLVTDAKIDNVNEIVPLLEQLVKTKEPVFIVAEDVTGEALSALVVNKMRGVLDVVAIKAPGFGDRRKAYLQDIAIATGSTYVAEEVGITLDSVTTDMLGTAERIVVAKELTTIVTDGTQQEAIEARIAQIRREAETAETDFDREKATERVAALGGGIARIKVGAATETELKDKKLRYEDALNSVDSARELGVVPGGGACLATLQKEMADTIMAAMDSEDERQGANILIKAMSAPCMQVAENAGIEGAVILAKVQSLAAEKGVSRLLLFFTCIFFCELCVVVCVTNAHLTHNVCLSFHRYIYNSLAGDGTQIRWNSATLWRGACWIPPRLPSMPLRTLPVLPDLYLQQNASLPRSLSKCRKR